MYCRAVLPNAGLGNKLFPWARCRVFSLEHGMPMLTPSWSQLKLGPILRRDGDARTYNDLFRASLPGQVNGVRQVWLRLSAGPIDEPADLHLPPMRAESKRIVVFKGAKDYFGSLTASHEVLLTELRAMTRERWVRRADEVGPAAIGIHVRRGDFAEPSSEADFILRGAIRTPMEWFIHSLQTIRQMSGRTVPAVVVSDAPDRVLAPLLEQAAVTRAATGSAIGDLLVLSQAKVLIASGGSTFSGWAAFLGQMPTVAYPGQSLEWFSIVPTRNQYLGEWNHRQPTPRHLVDQIQELGQPLSTSARC
jgi:hypothetical protein